MKVHSRLAAAAAIMVVASASLPGVRAAAQSAPASQFHREGMALLRGVNLTDAQKQQVHDIIRGAWQKARPAVEKMRALRARIVAKILTAGSTADDLKPLLQQQQHLRAELDDARLAAAMQVRAVLTPAQLDQAAKTHARLEALHAEERAVLAGAASGTP